MAAQAIPVILIGRTEAIGKPMVEALKPEVEVIHFMDSAEVAAEDIPLLLSGHPPTQPTFKSIGTQDYSRKPQAVVTGGYFTNDMVNALIRDCGGSQGIPWLAAGVVEGRREDIDKQAADPLAYVPTIASRVKEAIQRVKAEGNWDKDGMYNY